MMKKFNPEELPPTISRCVERMRLDVARYEAVYGGHFHVPHIGLGNRKTCCINEHTLPILTCHESCLTTCAPGCYALIHIWCAYQNSRNCYAKNTVLRRIDPFAYYDAFYREAMRKNCAIRLSESGDFENIDQVNACLSAARAYPSVDAIVYTKRPELLYAFSSRPKSFHLRYSCWENDVSGADLSRSMGIAHTKVVSDGTGNCPYQNRMGKVKRICREIMAGNGFEYKQAMRLAESRVEPWHCQTCIERGCGCAGGGDIRFNKV